MIADSMYQMLHDKFCFFVVFAGTSCPLFYAYVQPILPGFLSVSVTMVHHGHVRWEAAEY